MKLNVVPASRGSQWVKMGAQTFFRQPLALSGLFFVLLAVIAIIEILPYAGVPLALSVLPGAMVGMMAAARVASDGKFPMPLVLLSAFRTSRPQLRSILSLGALYALGIILFVGCTVLMDGGKLAGLLLMGNTPADEAMRDPNFQIALLLFPAFSFPWLLLFSHAAALAHWHSVPPVKSLFFAVTAIVRNIGAYFVYGLVWIGVLISLCMIMAILGGLLGSLEAVAVVLYPCFLFMTAIVFTSLYFTFIDSFPITPGADT